LNLSTSLAKTIDGAIGIFSPKAALNRKYYREALTQNKKRSSSYAAAKTSRLTGEWSPTDASVNDLIRASSPAVRARVRQLVRDFPVFSRAVNVLIDNTVGDGIKYQSQIKTNSGDKLDKIAIQKAEDNFNFWADQADVSGKQHFYDLQDLCKRQDLECGEFLLVKRNVYDRGKRYIPFALQAVEPDWLTGSPSSKIAKGNEIDQGIEYKKSTGQVSYYHFTDPDGWGKSIKVAARNVIHGYQMIRPGQLRGISPFAPAVLIAHDISEYFDSEIDAAKLASKWLAFVKNSPTATRTILQDGTGDDEGKKIDELENGIIEYLRRGEEVTLASNPRPGTNFPPTIKIMLSMVAATVNVPYELLSCDYQGLNYSMSRVSRNDFSHYLKPLITRHVRQMTLPAFYPMMEASVMAGKLPFKDFFSNPAKYLKAEWQGPGVHAIDPLRESKAKIAEVEAGLRAPQETTAERGVDYEEMLRKIKRAREIQKDLKLEFGSPSTSVANNPAAVESQKSANNLITARTNGISEDVESMIMDVIDKLDGVLLKN